MPDQCQAKNQNGSPCSARHWKDGWCRWHHPDLATERRAWSAKGGRNASNAARAKKALTGDVRDLITVKSKLMSALDKVENGKLEPAAAAAMASLARAIMLISGGAEFESRIAELEREKADRTA